MVDVETRSPAGMHRARASMLASVGALLAAGVLVAAACSSSSTKSAPTTAGTNGSGAPATAAPASYKPPACDRPVEAVKATPVPGTPSDWMVTSFDGTQIRAHWFPVAGADAQHLHPTVLMGPGWSLPGDTDVNGPSVLGGINIKLLRDTGYNVLTWDPRGFGKSGGEAEVDSAEYEGRDVSRLIDWVATQPGVQLDRPGDPRMGMLGGSYGGGIQLVTAIDDCRVDAIVPTITWNSLGTALYPNDTIKLGWSKVLVIAASTAHLDPHITHAYDNAVATGTLDAADHDWFLARGPGEAVKKIRVPTLIVQGTADTLFPLSEGVTNYQLLKPTGVPLGMIWFCGGHGVCLTNPGDPSFVDNASINWLNRWVKRDTSVGTGPKVDLIDQNGKRYGVGDYPVPEAAPLTADGSGSLQLTEQGGSGPLKPPPEVVAKDPLAGLFSTIMPAKATNAVNVSIANGTGKAVLVVGAPELELTYSGTAAPGTRPTRVFAQFVDEKTGIVLGNQTTPIPVTLDGHTHTTKIPLAIVSQAMAPGDKVSLQLVATTVSFAPPRMPGSVHFEKIHVSLPVAKDLHPSG